MRRNLKRQLRGAQRPLTHTHAHTQSSAALVQNCQTVLSPPPPTTTMMTISTMTNARIGRVGSGGRRCRQFAFFIFVFHSKIGAVRYRARSTRRAYAIIVVGVSLPLSRRGSVRRICTHSAQVLRFSCLPHSPWLGSAAAPSL